MSAAQDTSMPANMVDVSAAGGSPEGSLFSSDSETTFTPESASGGELAWAELGNEQALPHASSGQSSHGGVGLDRGLLKEISGAQMAWTARSNTDSMESSLRLAQEHDHIPGEDSSSDAMRYLMEEIFASGSQDEVHEYAEYAEDEDQEFDEEYAYDGDEGYEGDYVYNHRHEDNSHNDEHKDDEDINDNEEQHNIASTIQVDHHLVDPNEFDEQDDFANNAQAVNDLLGFGLGLTLGIFVTAAVLLTIMALALKSSNETAFASLEYMLNIWEHTGGSILLDYFGRDGGFKGLRRVQELGLFERLSVRVKVSLEHKRLSMIQQQLLEARVRLGELLDIGRD